VPDVGELFPVHMAQSLQQLRPELELPALGEASRLLPSREPLCDGCPYIPTFDALLEAMGQLGGREAFVVVGDPGCIARSQLPPYELLDVKISLGSATGIAAGIAASQVRVRPGERKRVIAVCGDSSFLHSGMNGLIDAARIGAPMLAVILDNGTTALSGGQPHPGTPVDARGIPRRAVDLVALARETGAGSIQVVDLDRAQEIYGPIRAGMEHDGVAVVIARGQCVLHPVPRPEESSPGAAR
jgi:indolepyruvate ferredoxin oxidoreductase alpha subunit